jgi:hypothetical protein
MMLKKISRGKNKDDIPGGVKKWLTRRDLAI